MNATTSIDGGIQQRFWFQNLNDQNNFNLMVFKTKMVKFPKLLGFVFLTQNPNMADSMQLHIPYLKKNWNNFNCKIIKFINGIHNPA